MDCAAPGETSGRRTCDWFVGMLPTLGVCSGRRFAAAKKVWKGTAAVARFGEGRQLLGECVVRREGRRPEMGCGRGLG
jgi:hypothetical protein